jgi:hypothetical protein
VTPFTISSISAVSTGGGCANLTINFVAPGNLPATSFTLLSSSSLNGPFSAATGASITGGAGVYQATVSTCSMEFYEIQETQ